MSNGCHICYVKPESEMSEIHLGLKWFKDIISKIKVCLAWKLSSQSQEKEPKGTEADWLKVQWDIFTVMIRGTM